MAVESLTPESQALIRRALAFIATTSHLDGEFETRLGVERRELAEILIRWPAVDDSADGAPGTVAINNSLNEIANGLALSAEDWTQLGATRSDVQRVFAEWTTMRGSASTGAR